MTKTMDLLQNGGLYLKVNFAALEQLRRKIMQNYNWVVIGVGVIAKQPKRGTVAFDKGYIEVYEYPRADRAVITYTADGSQELIGAGSTEDALLYGVLDMEAAVSGGMNAMRLDYTAEVMEVMTSLRKDWGLVYPEER